MESHSRTPSILNTAAVALFAVLLIAAITFSGVSDVALTRIFLILAFGVGSVIVLVEIVPNKSRKRKALLIGLLGLILLGFDRLLIAAHSETATSLVLYLTALRELHWRPLLVGIITGTLVSSASALAIIRRRRLVENAKSEVKILTPLNDRNVGWRETVCGSVSLPEGDVQVLVEFPDGWWHLQSPVEVRGYSWSCRCEFGETGKYGHAYDVIALLGTSLKAEQYEHLPENVVRSNVVTVKRNSNEDFIDCPDVQLHQTRINDKNMITDLVKVCLVRCNPHITATEGDDRQYVDFDFWFLNLCLFPVSIESVLGSITFRKETSAEAILLAWNPILESKVAALNRPFRSDGRFNIRHFLAPHDVTTVASGSDKSEFKFHDLNIMITGGGVAGVRLAIPDFVFKGKPWIANAECDFIFASIAEAEAKIRELETANESLKSELNRLNRGASDHTERPETE